MAKKPALASVVSRYEKTLESSGNLYAAVKPYSNPTWETFQGSDILHPAQARAIISLAFLQIVTAWEDYIESVFVRYIAGASSPKKYKPVSRISAAKDILHAYQLLSLNDKYSQKRNHLGWNNWNEVESLAKIFLEFGRPFTKLSQIEMERLKDAITIRNRIAHNSSKCRSAFIELSKRHLGLGKNNALPQGFSTGKLLLIESNRLFGKNSTIKPFFEHYLDIFSSISKKICP